MHLTKLFAGIIAMLMLIPEANAQSAAYRVGVQDRLRLYVHEWPVLAGEFAVGAGGSLVLPLLGEVKAAGLTTAEIAAVIAERVRARTNMAKVPEAMVDVAHYRPFYIVGGVERPGEYPYRPDLVVLKAVSIAGGLYRSGALIPERDAIAAQSDLRVASERMLELRLREQRLRAEATEASEFPPAPGEASAAFNALLKEEQLLFNTRRERHFNQLTSLDTNIELARREIDSLNSQIASVLEQLASAKAEAVDNRQRVSKGVSNSGRSLPLERAVAQIEREKKELDSAVLRTSQQIVLYRREIFDLIANRKSTALSDLQTLKALTKETEEKAETAKRLLQSGREDLQDRADPTKPDDLHVRYLLVRQMNGISEEVEAAETTPVPPGSIVKVLRGQPLRRGSVSRLAPTIGVTSGAGIRN